MRLSSSKMDSYKWCEQKYKLAYIDKIKTRVSQPLILGRILHNQIDKFWKTFKLDTVSYIHDINYYSKELKRKINIRNVETKVKFINYFTNFLNYQMLRIKKYIEEFNDDFSAITAHFYPLLTEEKDTYVIGEHVFVYILDALFYNEFGNLIVDWKSDKSCNLSDFKSHLPQLNRYSYAMNKNPYKGILESTYKHNKRVGIFFLKESKFYSTNVSKNYSLDREIIQFVNKLKHSKFKKVPKCERDKCYTKGYECEYYPEYCGGA